MSATQEFRELWANHDGNIPNIFIFIAQHSSVTQTECVELVELDEHFRTQLGIPLSKEDYLRQIPGLAATVQKDDPTQCSDLLAGLSISDSEATDNNSITVELTDDQASARQQQVGRYELFEMLGEGASGRVYLGYDQELRRQVAVKLPPPSSFRTSHDAEAFLREARTVATLDHPHIAPVYDAGHIPDGRVYVVCKLIQGCTLSQLQQSRPLTFDEISQLTATAANALHHAHRRGIIHRDIKPSNLMVESATQSLYVVDFGLAVSVEDINRKRRSAGTPAYMSPEQARGEGHRLDGRSDVFSLGIVLYQLLTGKRPFTGATSNEVLHQVITLEPPAPRDLLLSVPAELNRICLKAIAKRINERYQTAAELAEDLQSWRLLEERNSNRRTLAATVVIPRGLRSFGADDSDFFLELLPGPRDRDGLPESIAFWKRRIEETQADATFSVGIIYGPSGCGKSSLVKAGLLPCLSDQVAVVYVEATGEETESRIIRGLEKSFPDVTLQGDLADVFMQLREGSNRKTVVIIDQFEQWLNSHRAESESLLVRALRQCEGGHVQAILLVRDDFAMAAARFMEVLEIPIIQGHNFATVDMFDSLHAKKVLRRFGHAYGRVPDASQPLTDDQSQFIDSVVQGLAREGRVVSIQISILAEMVKGREWTPATLNDLGSIDGIGVRFLEDTFAGRSANPRHAKCEVAARNVLMALLPEIGTDIKGHMRSHRELQDASMIDNEAEFNELLRMLDGELRLITPTDPDGVRSQSAEDHELKHYQLTHDFLVPSLRNWLTLKQRESRAGRAYLKLAEFTALWTQRPEKRNLPSLSEYVSMLWHVPKGTRSEAQKAMLSAASSMLGLRWGLGIFSLILVLLAASFFVSTQRAYVAANRADSERKQASVLVDWVVAAPPEALPYVLPGLEPLKAYATPMLEGSLDDDQSRPLRRLRSGLALAYLGGGNTEFLIQSIESAPSNECNNIIQGLQSDREAALRIIRQYALALARDKNWLVLSRFAIVAAHLGDDSIMRTMLLERADPIQRTVLIDVATRWHGDWNECLVTPTAEQDPAFRTLVCLAVGGMEAPNNGIGVERLIDVISEWYRRFPDASTHGAAKWCLGRLNRPLPNLDLPGNVPFEWQVNSIGSTMVLISPGTFSRKTRENRSDAMKNQSVALSRRFWISDCEITQSQFMSFVEESNYPEDLRSSKWTPVSSSTEDSLPAKDLSWRDAVQFCNWLSECEGFTPAFKKTNGVWKYTSGTNGYRLATEAEWEYACRAGSSARFFFGDDLSLLEKYGVVNENRLQPVGSRMPNPFGLFDMHGNLHEWCLDHYVAEYTTDERVVDPLVYPELEKEDPSHRRVLRGGTHAYGEDVARSESRGQNVETYRSHTIGFRIARDFQD